MPVKRYKPTTAGRRISSVDTFEDITTSKPEKKLTKILKKYSGRSKGKITVRHRGGGTRRRWREIDFKRDKYDIPAKVVSIEYDPNRGGRIALLHYADGEKRYMIAPHLLTVGDKVISSLKRQDVKIGNCFPIEEIPIGTEIYNIEMTPGKGSQLVRGAGAMAQIMAVEGAYATVKLPSGEVRMVLKRCMATIGQVSNPDYRLIRWGKAGRTRHRGIKPTVRGKAMNPVDHPHGGGEGSNGIGLKHPKTPTGKPALGVKTRGKCASDKFILQRRKKGRFVGKGK
ncbi:MAG: 50S ribosomal protein L2 [Candidatus Uhrbacteria bacterium GW2011_GWE2_40_58]|nr:MAG: 50S ribosomal protein L2 [Candidatus Uhrbacteria bacterium GW2011_GWF2_40_263]KKR67511.1 MAG: 50S ribosomal protein L2 [Candidatus Uhrbacteria bacterium GW2011_GWE2_40_58]OGL93700.1 MAG: 50S ribosomal protein L2 [Candidatus Uhrbacteria bacterium RIFOXYA2_FULL_40_9]OGL96437.1 MAG: 50S ribosomal protein L2 [Candidatus Uhrbacteria bacterium RIFOXYB2_FULL_41_18]HBK34845.1 50S ribosomal protein L2 [Candidatus Uhrbacteria bacterium]